MTLKRHFALNSVCAGVFGAVKPGFRSLATLKLVMNVVGDFKLKRTAAASRGFLATARFSCITIPLYNARLQYNTNNGLYRHAVA